jgi:hypothetical protein
MTSVLLNKLSFNRNYPRAVTYGPIAFGGLAIPYIYVEQGISKIGLLLRHLSSESELGNSLTIAICASQLEAGVSWDILERPSHIPHLTDTWIAALCNFMAPHNIQLKLCTQTKWHSYAINSEHDTFIMDHLIKSTLYSDKELGDLNRVRIFHRALTVSDIANAQGDRINEQYYSNKTRPAWKDHSSSWRWPSKPLITNYQQNLWTKAIKRIFTDKHGKLKQRLGRWTKITHRRVPWWYYSPSEKILMKRITIDGDTVKYDIYGQRNTTSDSGFSTSPEQRISVTDTNTWLYIPAAVTTRGDRLTAHHRSYKIPATRTMATSLQEFVKQQSTPRQRLIAGLTLLHEDALYWVRHQWESNGLLVSATDGFAPDDGTFGGGGG